VNRGNEPFLFRPDGGVGFASEPRIPPRAESCKRAAKASNPVAVRVGLPGEGPPLGLRSRSGNAKRRERRWSPFLYPSLTFGPSPDRAEVRVSWSRPVRRGELDFF